MIKTILNLFKPKVKPTTNNPEFKKPEWAFQFNNDEPVLLANAEKDQNKLVIKIGIKESSVITFKDGKGNEFKIFAREQIENYSIGQKTI
jgi:hypothetical protein